MLQPAMLRTPSKMLEIGLSVFKSVFCMLMFPFLWRVLFTFYSIRAMFRLQTPGNMLHLK